MPGTKPAVFSIMSYKTNILTGLACLFASAAAFADIQVGQAFPDLSTFSLEGKLPARTGQVVLVDFWATWCAPCKSSFPAYSDLQREFSDRGVVVVAVSVDKTRGPYEEFVQRFAPSFTTVRDGQQKLVAAAQVPAMPTAYLIDRKGVLRAVHSGFHGADSVRALREEINRLLEEKL